MYQSLHYNMSNIDEPSLHTHHNLQFVISLDKSLPRPDTTQFAHLQAVSSQLRLLIFYYPCRIVFTPVQHILPTYKLSQAFPSFPLWLLNPLYPYTGQPKHLPASAPFLRASIEHPRYIQALASLPSTTAADAYPHHPCPAFLSFA